MMKNNSSNHNNKIRKLNQMQEGSETNELIDLRKP